MSYENRRKMTDQRKNIKNVGTKLVSFTDGSRAIIHCGGPEFKISVGGKIYQFEMHPWCGPNILNRRGEPLKNQPEDFLMAASLWAQQGQKVESGLCVWHYPAEDILEHIGGRHYRVIGQKPPVRGS